MSILPNGTVRGTGATIQWNGKVTEAMLRKRMRVRVLAASNYLQNITKKNVGHSGWGSATGGSASKSKIIKKKDASGKRRRYQIDYRPSKPGNFPHLDTGDLRKSIFRSAVKEDSKGIECIVGTILDYAIMHELGDRPFLTRTAREEEVTLRRILAGEHSGRSGPIQ